MDVEKLIEEQKKTREAIELLRNSKTYDELLKNIPEVDLDWREQLMLHIDAWDYDGSSETYDMQAAYYVREAVKNFGKAKVCLSAVKKHYENSIKEWEEYRDYLKTQKKTRKDDWSKMYQNPVCQKFFEDYEKANGITNSIYQEAKKRERKREKYNAHQREYRRKKYGRKKEGGEE